MAPRPCTYEEGAGSPSCAPQDTMLHQQQWLEDRRKTAAVWKGARPLRVGELARPWASSQAPHSAPTSVSLPLSLLLSLLSHLRLSQSIVAVLIRKHPQGQVFYNDHFLPSQRCHQTDSSPTKERRANIHNARGVAGLKPGCPASTPSGRQTEGLMREVRTAMNTKGEAGCLHTCVDTQRHKLRN